MVAVPDERLDRLRPRCTHPKKYTPAVIEFVDIAGLVKGAIQGRGTGQQVPRATSAATDAIVHVVRCFDDEQYHPCGRQHRSPCRDIEIINLELVMADIEMVDRRIEKAHEGCQGRQKVPARRLRSCRLCWSTSTKARLHAPSTAPRMSWPCLQTSDLLSLKNDHLCRESGRRCALRTATENQSLQSGGRAGCRERAHRCCPICAKLEADIAELDDPEEKADVPGGTGH